VKLIADIMSLIGERFENEEMMLPELIVAANVVKAAIDEVLDPAIKESGREMATKGKIVIGTVEGDVHSIGKDLVASFLFANGYEVYNVGVDVPASKFIEKAEEVGADVIAMSSLITLSMDFQKEVIDELEKRHLKEKYITIVGGAPTSEDWASKIGADGWADDALETVRLLDEIILRKNK
jgi:methanogenic corrinoid protein MtbC1